MRDLARLAIAAFGRGGEGSGVVGVDVQRIRRTLGLQAPGAAEGEATSADLDRESLNRSSATCGASSSAALIERTERLPPLRPLAEPRPRAAHQPDPGPDRGAPRRRPAQAPPGDARPRAARAPPRRDVDVRRTMRASLETGGVPLRLKLPAQAPPPPGDLRALRRLDLGHLGERLLPLACCTPCTTRSASCAASCSSSGSPRSPTCSSASATSADLRADQPRGRRRRRLRLHRLRSRVARVPRAEIADDLDPRSTVIVLGDARTNGREPHAEVFARVAERAGPHLLAQPRAAPVLELRRLGDGGVRAPLRRRLRVLDYPAPRGLRQRGRGRHAAGRLSGPRRGTLSLDEHRGARR